MLNLLVRTGMRSISPRSWTALALAFVTSLALGATLLWRLDLANDAERAADAAYERAFSAALIGVDAAGVDADANLLRARIAPLIVGDPSLRAPAEALIAAAASPESDRLAAARAFVNAANAAAATAEAAGDSVDTRGDAIVWAIAPLAAAFILFSLASVLADRRAALRGAAASAQARARAEDDAAIKSLMLAAASHDVRQPLHAMALLLSALKRRVPDGEATEIVEKIERAAAALRRLFASLLDVARLEAGVVRAQARPFPLAPLLDQLVSEANEIAAARGNSVVAEPCPLWLNTDPQLLEAVIRNLLSNAVKVSHGGPVHVACVSEGALARIDVRDSGHDTTQDALDRLFAARPAPRDATGLGLFIVREMAAILRADVQAALAPGGGAIVSVRLPRIDPPSSDDETDTAPAAPS